MRARADLQLTLRRLAAVSTAVVIVMFAICNETTISDAQRRQSQPRPVNKNQRISKITRDYSIFKHDDHRKNLECSSCHVIPSAADSDRIAPATKPNATSSYPYHDSCFRCHRQQVYRGDRPVICTVCHTRVSPRATARDIYAQFPSPKRGEMMTREFPGYFPHGLHQSLMATRQTPRSETAATFQFVRTSFRRASDELSTRKDICSVCHFTDDRGPLSLPLAGISTEETLRGIPADTFKTTPGYLKASAHGSCFNCHWESQKPTKDDCNGCHLSRSDFTARGLRITDSPTISAATAKWFANWPNEIPKRISLKFRHNTHTPSPDGKTVSNNHDLGCTTCHANIVEMTTLNIPKADVQILSCAPCHLATSAIPVSPKIRVTIFDEMVLKSDATKNYTCVACHTSVVGRERPPCSHYSVIGEPCSKPAP